MTLEEAIVGKISHDLAGGIGAVASTTELMDIDPNFSNEAVPILKQSTSILMARLRFYRSLFGAETKTISNQIIEDYLKTIGQKISFSGKVSSRLQLTLVAISILLLGEGGEIKLIDNEVHLKGPEVLGRKEFKEILAGKNIEITPENIEFHWLMQQINHHKKTLTANFKVSSAKLSIID